MVLRGSERWQRGRRGGSAVSDWRKAFRGKKRSGKKRVDREHPEQSTIVRLLRLNRVVFNAQSNGLRLAPSQAKKAVMDGLEKGCPDLILFSTPSPSDKDLEDLGHDEMSIVELLKSLDHESLSRVLRCAGCGPGVALEMKTIDKKPKTDRAHRWSGARPEQKEWLSTLEALGWTCFVGYGADDAAKKLSSVGILPKRGGES